MTVVAPGRVNLIGDHTDYMGGLVLPMAIQFSTRIEATPLGGRIALRSDISADALDIALPASDSPGVEPRWGRHVAAVAELLGCVDGIDGTITSDLPIGSGLSSSAALSVATALSLGASTGDPQRLAELCQAAEQLATGVPCGIMDQLAIVAARAGQALLIDCATLATDHVHLPDTAQWWVVHSGQHRELVGSEYAQRRAECERAVELVGPLPRAAYSDIDSIADPVVRARARHVRSECDRVTAAVAALRHGDLVEMGHLMDQSHASLRDDFRVSTDALDATVQAARATPGVLGARLTGAGFGGCVVALAEPGADLPGLIDRGGRSGWTVQPSSGALELLAE